MPQTSCGTYADRVVKFFYSGTNLYQFDRNRFQMFWNHISDDNIAFRSSSGYHKCSCFNLIRYNRIFTCMKRFYSVNTNLICSGTANIGSHAVQEVGNIYDMRLFCCVLNNCLTFCHCCCHHDIDGSTHSYHIKVNMASDKTFCFCNDQSMFNSYICPQSPKAFDMLVNRAKTDITSTRKSYFRFFIFSK